MNYLQQILLVGMGGFLGSAARFATGTAVTRWVDVSTIPLATLTVNVVGCFAIGALAGLGDGISQERRLLLQFGLLGGFTTFSAFGMESLTMLRLGLYGRATLNIALQVIIGIAAAAVGLSLTKTP